MTSTYSHCERVVMALAEVGIPAYVVNGRARTPAWTDPDPRIVHRAHRVAGGTMTFDEWTTAIRRRCGQSTIDWLARWGV